LQGKVERYSGSVGTGLGFASFSGNGRENLKPIETANYAAGDWTARHLSITARTMRCTAGSAPTNS